MNRYAAPIVVDVEYTQGSPDNPRKETKVIEHYSCFKLLKICFINHNIYFSQANVVIGRMPIMLRSCCCVLYGKDETELAQDGLYNLKTIFIHLVVLLVFCIFQFFL